ncbi:MAG: ethanolamine ammonia-lyase subunit EutB, partial [Planctomycetaceae bacterium]|nr:ethanolamine ammonia-lyase subunit EutB [Planctomycetaceae bacterium]
MLALNRRAFLSTVSGGSLALATGMAWAVEAPRFPATQLNEGLVAYLQRTRGQFDLDQWKRLLGAANEFKEGDAIVGVAAADDEQRELARGLLLHTRLTDIDAHPPLTDDLYRFIQNHLDKPTQQRLGAWTLAELKSFLLTKDEPAIQAIMPGLSSDVIGCVVKLMTNAELTAVGAKVFNPLPGSQIGAKGYLGARIQPNSPTDNVDDIRWQVFNGFSYAVGDVVLGNNPVSSDPKSVAAIERTLLDVLQTFDLFDTLPHCVLAHVDVQAEAERIDPGSTALWFQSIAGSDTANGTFDITVEKMRQYAAARTGPYGLYFETGQGADFTNGHGHGYDMVLHESRKYGFARALSHAVAEARAAVGHPGKPWVHLNDVAGFIGPEVFRTREQLVRCCLEDIVMGKLHGLCLGLDVCSTLHMDVSLDDLDWCLEQLV